MLTSYVMMPITVCKDCTERYPACWGSCPKYIQAKTARDEQKDILIEKEKTRKATSAVQYFGLNRSRKK